MFHELFEVMGVFVFLLHHAKKRPEQARQCISEAIELFEDCQAAGFLERARNTLSTL